MNSKIYLTKIGHNYWLLLLLLSVLLFPASFVVVIVVVFVWFGLVSSEREISDLQHLFVTGFVKNTLTDTSLLVIPPSASLNPQCIHQAYWLSSLLTSPSLHCR